MPEDIIIQQSLLIAISQCVRSKKFPYSFTQHNTFINYTLTKAITLPFAIMKAMHMVENVMVPQC